MSFTVVREENPAYDVIRMCETLLSGGSMQEEVDKLQESAEGAGADRLFAAALAIEQALQPVVDAMTKTERFLFASHSGNASPAEAFWRSASYIDSRYHTLLYSQMITVEVEEDIVLADEAEFFSWVEQLDCSDEEKIDVLKVFHNFGPYQEMIREFLERAIPRLEEIYQEHRPVMKDQAARLEEIFQKDGYGFFLEAVGLRLDPKAYQVRLSAAAPNTISTFAYDDAADTIVLGSTFLDILALVRRVQNASDRVPEFLKVLADPTKRSILVMLKEHGWMYSAQIAKALDLSAATISHHMSSLISQELVSVQKEGKRGYYARNEKRIGELLSRVQAMLGAPPPTP